MGKPGQTGEIGVGHQKAHFPAVLRKACLPSSPEEKNELYHNSFRLYDWEMDGSDGIEFYLISMIIAWAPV